MKRFIPFLLIIVFASFYYNYLQEGTSSSLEPALLEKKGEFFPATVTAPAIQLKGTYISLIDAETGRLLYGKNSEKEAPMASTTKIMTSILALESGRTSETVTASSKASSMPKVHLGMKKGETFLLSDLLYSLMLESHNDSAVAIAEHLEGSVESFAKKMNEKAKKLHMMHTNFVTPNGLDANGHHSTAYDMCLLGGYAIKSKDFLSLIQTPSHTFTSPSSGRTFSVSNKDAFLSIYEGALGIKTGFTNKAGYCFVGAAKRDNRTFVSATLASGWPPNKSYKWQDTKALMDFGFTYYKKKELPTKDLSYLKIPVKNGISEENIQNPVVSCKVDTPPSLLLSEFDSIRVEYRIADELQAPVKTTVIIGYIDYYINDKKAFSRSVYPDQNVRKVRYIDILKSIFHIFLQ